MFGAVGMRPAGTHTPGLRSLVGCAKALAAIAVTLALFVPQLLVRACTRGPASFVLPQFWHRALCGILAIRIDRNGAVDARPGTIHVGNHLSHFDIFAVGSLVRAAFIAKGEMAGWPGMRLLGAMQQTLFVSRRARDAGAVAAQVAQARRQGRRLVLFAEGTTSSGMSVAPFKSSLFAVFGEPGDDTASVAVLQPFTLELVETDGQPCASAEARDLYAFHGGAEAGAHVWRFLRSRGARLRITFHPALPIHPGASRKDLAASAHAVVSGGLRATQVAS